MFSIVEVAGWIADGSRGLPDDLVPKALIGWLWAGRYQLDLGLKLGGIGFSFVGFVGFCEVLVLLWTFFLSVVGLRHGGEFFLFPVAHLILGAGMIG